MPGNVLIGKQLGDYKIVSSLGQGGMAHVYKGYDENLDRYAAVKVIEPTVMPVEDEIEYRERFVREAKAIAKLNHPRIVGVYQFGKTEMTQELAAMYYMAMVFVEGRDLRQVLKEYTNRKRRMSNAQVLRIMRDTADALDYAHEQGVIHRDVKPSNIMITNEGRAVLTDFGLALRTQEGTMGNTFGSVHYIAPEQAVSSAQATAQSDLYSLGIVLYEILTGRVPFDDNSAMSVALSQIQDPPPPPRSINPAIPEEVEAVILKALEKDAVNRYQSGLQFIQALERAFASAVDEDTHDLDEVNSNPFNQLEKLDEHLFPDIGSAPLPSFKEITEHEKPEELKQANLADHVGLSDKVAAGARPGEVISDDVLQTSEKTSASYPTPRDRRNVVGGGGGGGSSIKSPLSGFQPESGSRTVWYAGGAVVLILLLVISAMLLSGGGGPSEADMTSTADALALAIANETETEVAAIAFAATETATHQPTATDTATATVTDEPTDEPTDEAATDEPSATSTDDVTATATTEPTETATNEPTETPTNTATNEPTSTPAATNTPEIASASPDEPQVLLRYDGRTVVVYNRSEEIISLGSLAFVGPGGEFRSDGWAQRFTVNPEVCYQVWTLQFATLEEDDFPADICGSRRGFNATSRTFWISQEPTTFEVQRNGLVLAECPTVPQNSTDEIRCLVDVRGVTSP